MASTSRAESAARNPPVKDTSVKFQTPENADYLLKRPYSPLKSDQQEIRLLKAHPKILDASSVNENYPNWPLKESVDSSILGGKIIACELVGPFSIASIRGRYHALSYRAGSPQDAGIFRP